MAELKVYYEIKNFQMFYVFWNHAAFTANPWCTVFDIKHSLYEYDKPIPISNMSNNHKALKMLYIMRKAGK